MEVKSRKQEFSELAKKMDVFGTDPKLFIDGDVKYKTIFGTILSWVLLGVVVVAAYIYGKDIYFKQNPNSIFTEESVEHPHKYPIQKNKMNFAMGLQDRNWTHFIDPTIYRFSMVQKRAIQRENEKGEKVFEIETRDLHPRGCKPEDFGVATEYFHSLKWLSQLYCIDEYYDDLDIEGDFGTHVYSFIQAEYFPCVNDTVPGVVCKNDTQIAEKLQDGFFALYTSDNVVNPKNFSNPFDEVGRNLFGVFEQTMYKQVEFYFGNVFLEDNTGIVFDSWETRRGLQYYEQKEIIKLVPQDGKKFLTMNIRLQKTKQTRIFRTYLNLAQVLANVGGIMKVAMLVLFIVSSYVGSTMYNMNMVNSLFNFEYDYGGKDKKKDLQAWKKKQLYISSFFSYFLCGFCAKRHVKTQKKLLKYSTQKLGYHLNIKSIIHKLMEIDKLKMLLLDDHQIQLFEYIPKPVINESLIEKDQKGQVSSTTDSNSQQNNEEKEVKTGQINNSNNNNKRQMQRRKTKAINILQEDNRDNDQRETDAFLAFKNIKMKKKLKKIDEKLLNTMDQKLLTEFSSRFEETVDKLNLNQHLKINGMDINNNNQNDTSYDFDFSRCSLRKGTLDKSQEGFQNSQLPLQSKFKKDQSNKLSFYSDMIFGKDQSPNNNNNDSYQKSPEEYFADQKFDVNQEFGDQLSAKISSSPRKKQKSVTQVLSVNVVNEDSQEVSKRSYRDSDMRIRKYSQGQSIISLPEVKEIHTLRPIKRLNNSNINNSNSNSFQANQKSSTDIEKQSNSSELSYHK